MFCLKWLGGRDIYDCFFTSIHILYGFWIKMVDAGINEDDNGDSSNDDDTDDSNEIKKSYTSLTFFVIESVILDCSNIINTLFVSIL